MASDSTDEIQDYLKQWAQNVVDTIRMNLVRKDPYYDESELAQSIEPIVTATPNGYQLTIVMNDYWEYIDKGRKGTRNKSGTGSVRKNLLLWISKRAFPLPLVRTYTDKKTGKQRTQRFKDTLQARDAFAYAAAANIHKKGFVAKGKGFFTEVWNEETINELLQTLLTKSGEVFVAEIIEE